MHATKTPQSNGKTDLAGRSMSRPAIPFTDNRAIAVAQRRLQEMANRASEKRLAPMPANSGAPVQRAVLNPDSDVSSFIPTLKKLNNDLILAARDDTELTKIAEFLSKEPVIDALEVLRETDAAFNFSTVLAAFRAKCSGRVTEQRTIALANALGKDTLTKANLSVEQNDLLKDGLRVSGYITTDDDRAAARREQEDARAINAIKAKFSDYTATFQHIFQGDFSTTGTGIPTGYHAQNGGSTTHVAYGTVTDLGHDTYQQSVRATPDSGGKKKPYRSTFFPSTASEEDIKVAVVSGNQRHDKTVQYPRSLEGLPLIKTGATIYPNTGVNTAPE